MEGEQPGDGVACLPGQLRIVTPVQVEVCSGSMFYRPQCKHCLLEALQCNGPVTHEEATAEVPAVGNDDLG